jgi:hypothetical protein
MQRVITGTKTISMVATVMKRRNTKQSCALAFAASDLVVVVVVGR